MPKRVHLEFIIQRLVDNTWVVDLWDKIADEPMACSYGGQRFDTKEEAIAWCDTYRPGRYPTRSISVYEHKDRV